MNSTDSVRLFKKELKRIKRFANQVYACINFSQNDDMALRTQVVAACLFKRTPKMKTPPRELGDDQEQEFYLRLIEAETPSDIIPIIKLLGVGTEMWRAAVRRLKNMLMNKDGWA